MYERYAALFALRNDGGNKAITAIIDSLGSKSALLKHEVAYVLGQLQDKAVSAALSNILRDVNEHPMVRHEAAEALGSIADDQSVALLEEFTADPEALVSQSCQVALSMLEAERSGKSFEFLFMRNPTVVVRFRPISANSIFKTQNNVIPTYKTSSQLVASQIRWLSKATPTEEDKISIGPASGRQFEEGDKETGIFYYGPISSTIKKVKLMSLSSCCLSVSLSPVITFMTSPDSNVILKGAVASSVILFSASLTAILHWFVSPYIHKLRWQPGSDSFEMEMLSWLATHIPKTIKFSDIRPADTNRPYVTFKANGNFYFVDSEHCHNKALLARLTPQKETHDSGFKNL
ncbi:hypothetical protein KIW84_013020 [Lathyrus oleraceus]|uniref:Deoxyhypusine monooxygenase n=1 Tax=Pisum sativum TaxID=3888 RepID=A0A9D5BJG4_PEA|nr:hypothetical protein KIW84_013020 [Pisum sativum]